MIHSFQNLSNKTIPRAVITNVLPLVDRDLVADKSLNRLATLNNQGYMLSYLHKISRAFVEFSSMAPGPVLDIGTAYGLVVLEALQRGATVIANDLEIEHLEDLHKRVPKSDLDRISYAVGQVPREVTFSQNSLGAVLASGVLHYLSPPEFSLAIVNIASWLIPGGKFFLATPTPYTNFYHKFFPTFLKSHKLNKQWPGYIEDASKILPSFFTNVPKTVYLIDEKFITTSLEENGLKVEKIGFFDIKLPTTQFNKQTNVLGVIAHKL